MKRKEHFEIQKDLVTNCFMVWRDRVLRFWSTVALGILVPATIIGSRGRLWWPEK